jgi:tRNA threonylcarbamoyladenosine biosynthesis protein TsaB
VTKILSIDTSSEGCSVAIHEDSILIASSVVSVAKSHSNLLVTMIDQLLSNTAIPLTDIDAFAYSEGPGSYTGLRIGLSTLKGLCFSLDKPLIGLSTLFLMAHQVTTYASSECLFMPLIDARRDEVYASLYSYSLDEIIPPTPFIVDGAFMNFKLESSKIVFFGSGSAKTKSLISNPNAYFLNVPSHKASDMGQIAFTHFCDRNFVDIINYEPFYLKKFYTPNKLNKS